MPISDSEARQFYEAMVARARDIGLHWIVAQVEEQLALGNVALRSLSVKERDLFSDEPEIFEVKPQRRKNTRATFLVSRSYTVQERLELLVDSLLIGVVQLNQIADKVVAFAAAELGSSSIEFAPEAGVKPILRLEVEGNRVTRATEASEKLAVLLSELKREIADAR